MLSGLLDIYFQVKENEDIMQTVVASDNNYVVCCLFRYIILLHHEPL
ncbi:hypothetical protein AtEden1_Chr3g0175391 [Arabidopsis thaliana]